MIISEIETTFRKTGTTPAHGISYVSDDKDMCATIYGYGENKKARVYSDRKAGFEDRDKLPCFYDNMIVLEN